MLIIVVKIDFLCARESFSEIIDDVVKIFKWDVLF